MAKLLPASPQFAPIVQISHEEIKKVFGADSKELEAAKVADGYQAELQDNPDRTSFPKLSEDSFLQLESDLGINNDTVQKSQNNGMYEGFEVSGLGNKHIELMGALNRVDALVQRDPSAVTVRLQNRQELLGRATGLVSEMPIDAFSPELKATAQVLGKIQHGMKDSLPTDKLDLVFVQFIAKAGMPISPDAEKVLEAFKRPKADGPQPTQVSLGKLGADVEHLGVQVTANVNTQFIQGGAIQTVQFDLKTVPNAIVTVEQHQDGSVEAQPGFWADPKTPNVQYPTTVVTYRADADGNVSLPAGTGTIRVLHPETMVELAGLHLDEPLIAVPTE